MHKQYIVKRAFAILLAIGGLSIVSGQIEKSVSNKNLILEAVISNNIETTKFLIEQGISVNSKYKYNHTLLHSAALYGDIKMVKLLVKNKSKLSKNNFDLTAINSAADMNHTDVVDYLESVYEKR